VAPGRHAQTPGGYRQNVLSYKLIDKLAAKFSRKLHEVPIGFKYICELMLEQNILIGGEESGGIGTSLYLPERDATVSALFLAEADGVARQNRLANCWPRCTRNLANSIMAGSIWT